jgi:hypothetical protein
MDARIALNHEGRWLQNNPQPLARLSQTPDVLSRVCSDPRTRTRDLMQLVLS